MDQYAVTGMSCAACQNRVERAVMKAEGVTSCSVSLLTNSMSVEGTASEAEIIKAVKEAGYGAVKIKDAKLSKKLAEQEEALKDHETPKLKRRLIASAGFLAALMYFSMGHMMWGAPVPAFLENYVSLAVLEMLLAICVLVINRNFFTSGFKALIRKGTNMDTLVALGSSAAFGYSLVALFMMIDAIGKGNSSAAMDIAVNHLYFESAAMIPALITIGKMLEALSKGRTTDALKNLMKLAPKTAVLYKDGEEIIVDIDKVKTGDVFIVRSGESVPVDGVIIDGSAAVNESALTGESIPVDKAEGDSVSAATINQSGYIRCRATRVGEDTTLSQIIQMVYNAAATKAPLERIADKVSGVFVPLIIALAAATCAVWLVLGKDFGWAFARAISVLVISCPCAMGLATPVAVMVGNGVGAKNGILYKTAQALEETGRIEIAALDKTGTITSGQPEVTDVITAPKTGENKLLTLAYALEKKSEHPLAKAVVRYCEKRGMSLKEVTNFETFAGNGLTAKMEGASLAGGNARFISEKADIPEKILKASEEFAEDGKTPIFFAKDKNLAGVIAVADVIREDSKDAVGSLKNMGIKVVALTGDNERTAKAIGAQAGVDLVIAQVLPGGKEKVIRELQKEGKVAMVGDGINDAPALTKADIGIAVGAGADVAVDAADVVLVKNRLIDMVAAVRLSRATIKNIHENLFWAFFYNAVCIPLAMGVYGVALKPMYGAAAMALSSFCVCMNALRLNLLKIYDAGHDKKITKHRPVKTAINKPASTTKEENKMTKTMKVEGMMCAHCEAAVKEALEAVDGVREAVASRESGTVLVTLEKNIADETLKAAVKEAGYEVREIE